MKNISIVLMIILCFSLVSCNNDDENITTNPIISFSRVETEVNKLTRSSMQNALTSHVISYYDTVYRKQKKLRAFELQDVLELGYNIDLETVSNATFTFKALDGFQDTATSIQVNESGGYIAFEDLDVDGIDNWEPVITENNNNPAPYYVVWINPQQTPSNSYPWPYQLFAIDMSE